MVGNLGRVIIDKMVFNVVNTKVEMGKDKVGKILQLGELTYLDEITCLLHSPFRMYLR